MEACLCAPGSLSPGFYVFATFMQLVLQLVASLLQPFAVASLLQKKIATSGATLFATFPPTVSNFFGNKKLQRSCKKLQNKLQKSCQTFANVVAKKLLKKTVAKTVA